MKVYCSIVTGQLTRPHRTFSTRTLVNLGIFRRIGREAIGRVEIVGIGGEGQQGWGV